MRAALSEIRRNPVSILFESQTQLRTNSINLGGVLEQPAIWNQPLSTVHAEQFLLVSPLERIRVWLPKQKSHSPVTWEVGSIFARCCPRSREPRMRTP